MAFHVIVCLADCLTDDSNEMWSFIFWGKKNTKKKKSSAAVVISASGVK